MILTDELHLLKHCCKWHSPDTAKKIQVIEEMPSTCDGTDNAELTVDLKWTVVTAVQHEGLFRQAKTK